MLGYTQPNNDLYIFFEGDDIENLGTRTIQGAYFNLKNPRKKALLEADVREHLEERVKTIGKRDENEFMTYYLIEIRPEVHEKVKRKGSFELHEGFRHICLIDASRQLSFNNQTIFEQLKYWREQCQKKG